MSKIPTQAREDIYVRDNRQCRRCGMRGSEIHHRQRRRDGGHGLGNMILLCSSCHKWAHANPVDARVAGFIVSAWVQDPATVTVSTFSGPMRFDDTGGVAYL